MNPYSRSDSQAGSLSGYLTEISRFPLLTRPEEVRLGNKIRDKDVVAVQRLVQSNLRFVVTVAKRYRGMGISFQDLIHEGNLGLIEAAWRFDPTRGVRFITYAVWWIRHSILCAISTYSTPIRLPVRAKRKCFRLYLAIRRRWESEQDATVEQLSQDLNLEPEEILRLLQISREPLSLSRGVSPDHSQTLAEEMASETSVTTANEALANRDRDRTLGALIGKLTPRERLIVQWRYGLYNQDSCTLQDIGERIGLSRERIRQIHEKAMAKLRNYSRFHKTGHPDS